MELNTVLAELFYQHDRVHIPGIGGFVLTYQPAAVDQIKGEANPPSKRVEFNPNLVLDDGLLSNHLQRQYGMTAEEAERQIESYTRQIHERIDQRELVELPGIGRLYRNYENKLQFLADETNFFPATFGLPSVDAQLVERQERPKPATEESKTAVPAPPADTSDRLAGWLQRNLLILGMLTVLLVVAGYYLLYQDALSDGEEGATVPEERLNVSPTDQSAPTELPTPSVESNSEPPISSAVVAIGLFSDSENVRKIRQRLSEAGYEFYSEVENGRTRVGIRLEFETEAELMESLSDIRDRFASDAFVMLRDGVRQE